MPINIKEMFLKKISYGGETPARPGNQALTVSVINQKGGCGKTTTVINLSACLVELGKKVLVIDIDPQAHATLGLGIQLDGSAKSLYHVLVNPEVPISVSVRETYHDCLRLIPSHSLLSSAQIDLIDIIGRENLLRQKLSAIKGEYDFIFIDCPPSLNLLTLNALTASDGLIIPIQTHFYSLNGMSELLNTVEIVKRRLNPNLEILGVLPTLFDKRTRTNHQILKAVKEYFKGNIRVFETTVHNCISLAESPIHGKPIIKFRRNSRGSEDYRNLAKEVAGIIEERKAIK